MATDANPSTSDRADRLRAGMPAIDGFRIVLRRLDDAVRANWQGTIDHVDPEHLHELRVAVRRTRVVLSQGRDVLPAAVVQRAQQHFALLNSLTGPARDLDVYLQQWPVYTANLPADQLVVLEPVHSLLQRRGDAAVAALVAGLQSAESERSMQWWREWLTTPTIDQPASKYAERRLGRVIERRIVRAQHHLIEEGRLIRPDTPAEQVHDLRKQAKKLRYLFDCFGDMVKQKRLKQFVARLKALQDILGEHQDAEVHAAVLKDVGHELAQRDAAPSTMLAIVTVDDRLAETKARTRRQFDKRFAKYDSKATRRALRAALARMH